MNHSGQGAIIDIVLGIVGAFVGGFVFNLFGARGVTGLNLWSLVVATLGAVAVLAIKHALFDGRRLA